MYLRLHSRSFLDRFFPVKKAFVPSASSLQPMLISLREIAYTKPPILL